jgi:hypothetical protein
VIRLASGRHEVALHRLRDAGPTLLCLHAAQARIEFCRFAPAWPAACSRSISRATAARIARAAGCTPELLATMPTWRSRGEVRVIGVGVGAYVALLLAGAPAAVRAYLLPGAGLEGGRCAASSTRKRGAVKPTR